jgi:hypothetical protein
MSRQNVDMLKHFQTVSEANSQQGLQAIEGRAQNSDADELKIPPQASDAHKHVEDPDSRYESEGEDVDPSLRSFFY